MAKLIYSVAPFVMKALESSLIFPSSQLKLRARINKRDIDGKVNGNRYVTVLKEDMFIKKKA